LEAAYTTPHGQSDAVTHVAGSGTEVEMSTASDDIKETDVR
jgi:hypothetical protein